MVNDIREDIRQRNDIVEVVSAYVPLRKAGKDFKGLCPFHQEKSPSFTVSREKQMFHCFGCHAGGDVFAFVMKIENLPFPDAARRLAERVGLRYEPSVREQRQVSEREQILELNRIAAEYFDSLLNDSSQGLTARQYLNGRGIRRETAQRFRLGFAADRWDALLIHFRQHGHAPEMVAKAGLAVPRQSGGGYYDRFRDRLIFPIQDLSGRVIAFGGRTLGQGEAAMQPAAKYINSPETAAFRKSETLYGLNFATRAIGEAASAIVVEGYMDVVSLVQAGFDNVVATMGTAVTPASVRLLSRYTQNVIAAFDSDSAGMAAVLRSADLFQDFDLSVRVLNLPDGLDPDSMVRDRGADALQQALLEAEPLFEYKLNRVLDRYSAAAGAMPPRAVSELLPVLLEIRNRIEREFSAQRVAAQWCRQRNLGEDHVRRVHQAILDLMAAEERKRRRGNAPARTDTDSDGPPDAAPPRLDSGDLKVERELLAAMLQNAAIARQVRDQLSAEQFIDPSDRRIAAMLFEQDLRGEHPDVEAVLAHVGHTETTDSLGNLVSELALQSGTADFTAQQVDERVQRIRNHGLRERYRQLKAIVPAAVDAGTLSPTDDLFLEYKTLYTHFKGSLSVDEE